LPSAGNRVERPLKIGEAAKLVGVEPYVLRFWETQFSFIRPRQSRSRHRHYTQSDVETLKLVRHLLHIEGYTIAGARRFVRENGLGGIKIPPSPPGRPATSRRTKERLDGLGRGSNTVALVGTTKNGAHRVLREIREDLLALHRLLEHP
jgi:DNA-binding transcriptional MerR regulator